MDLLSSRRTLGPPCWWVPRQRPGLEGEGAVSLFQGWQLSCRFVCPLCSFKRGGHWFWLLFLLSLFFCLQGVASDSLDINLLGFGNQGSLHVCVLRVGTCSTMVGGQKSNQPCRRYPPKGPQIALLVAQLTIGLCFITGNDHLPAHPRATCLSA